MSVVLRVNDGYHAIMKNHAASFELFGSCLASSGHNCSQLSGQRSCRVTKPLVAISICGQRSKGIGLTPLRHWLINEGATPSFLANPAFESISERYFSKFMKTTIANAVEKSNSICDFACRDFGDKIMCMDEEEEKRIRWELLVDLIKEAGGNAHFRDKYQRKDLKEGEEISVTFISQLKNKTRSFGPKAARKLERLSTLPSFYFDPWRKDRESITPEIGEFLSKKELLRAKLKEIIDNTEDEEKLIQAAGFLHYINSSEERDNRDKDNDNNKSNKRTSKK